MSSLKFQFTRFLLFSQTPVHKIFFLFSQTLAHKIHFFFLSNSSSLDPSYFSNSSSQDSSSLKVQFTRFFLFSQSKIPILSRRFRERVPQLVMLKWKEITIQFWSSVLLDGFQKDVRFVDNLVHCQAQSSVKAFQDFLSCKVTKHPILYWAVPYLKDLSFELYFFSQNA